MLKRFILHHSDCCTISDTLCGWVSRWMWLSDAMPLSQSRANGISCQHINEQFLSLFLLALCYHRSRSLIRITLKWWQTSITLRKKIVICSSRCDCWVIAFWNFPASTDRSTNAVRAIILSSLLGLAEISFVQGVRWSITTRAWLTCSAESEDVVVALKLLLLLSQWGLKTLVLIEIVLARISCLGHILLRSWNSNHLPARNRGIRQSRFWIKMLLIFTNRERLSRKFSSCKWIHPSFMRWYSSLSCC